MTQIKKWKGSFLTLATGQAVSLIGSSAVQFALIWWLTDKTSSAIMLSIAGIAAFLPQMILGTFAGVWIDRWKRKKVIIISDMSMGVLAALYALWFLLGTPPYWSVFVILMLRGLGGVFHTPAIQALIPLLVPDTHLMKANGWSQFMQSGSFMLGPVIGAAMYGVLPLWIILLSDLLGAIIASVTATLTKVAELPAKKVEAHYFKELKEGLKTLYTDKRLMVLLGGMTLCMVFYMPLATLYPLMTGAHFQLDALHASAVEFSFAAGMMLSAIIIGFLKIKHKLVFSAVGMSFVGLVTGISGLLPPTIIGFWIFVGMGLLLGAGGNCYNITCITYMQETLPPDKMGRAFATMSSLMSFSMPIGLILAGPVADKHGVNLWFLISGIVVTILSLATAFTLTAMRKNTTIATMASTNGIDNGEIEQCDKADND